MMKCENCKEVEIPEPEYCCSGWMCGCMGLPIDPPFCKKCWEEMSREPAPKVNGTTKHIGGIEMQSVNLSELRPGSYINLDGEIITKEKAQELIKAGDKPTLYTVSDQFIQEALDSLKSRNAEDYTAPDPYTKRVIY